MTYVVAKVTTVQDEISSSEVLIVAENLVSALKGEIEILQSMPGSALEHTKYQRPFDFVEIPDSHFVVLATYVTTEDGTG